MTWTTDPKNGRKVLDESGACVAIAQGTPKHPPQAWANAKRMAAAPDMLALLQRIDDELDDNRDARLPRELRKAVQATITKATTGVNQ